MIRGAGKIMVLCLVGILAGLSGWSPEQGQAAPVLGSLEEIKSRKELRVGLVNQVPSAMFDPNSKTWSGANYEIAKLVADAAEVKLTVLESTWQNILPALQTGKIDIGMSGFYATPKRATAVWFTIPYRYDRAAILIHKRNANRFSSLESFDNSNVTIAAHIGSASEDVVRRFFPKAKLKPLSTDTIILEVQAGRADAWVADSLTIRTAARRNTEWSMVWKPEIIFNAVPVVFVVRRGDLDLQMFVNATLEYYITQGVIGDILKKHGYEPLVKPR